MANKELELKILLYGYGNPGRQDDGLGVLFIEQISEWIKQKSISNIQTEQNYQLNVEDALTIAERDIVIFIDASHEDISSYDFKLIQSANEISFSTHAMGPASILSLCEELYHKKPLTFILTIKGYKWELKEELTSQAQQNLEQALNFIKKYLLQPELLLQY